MNLFEECSKINDFLNDGHENIARDCLIKILDFCEKNSIEYTPVLNHMIRQVGLYPYLKIKHATWQDRFVYEAFKADIGSKARVTLHREQSRVLSKLLNGEDLAISAPTSFGKSFIIDAFISIKNPDNILIIVPTIALTDETRRRLHRKFSDRYKIITTSDAVLAEKNILVFPQERAIQYANRLKTLDMLVVDEFYKASSRFDQDRSPSLLKAIMKLGEIAKQRYFLAPNISSLNENVFTKNMEFIEINFNTVFLDKFELYKDIGKSHDKKSDALISILNESAGKTLIYAGTYSNIDKVSNLIIDNYNVVHSEKLKHFHDWLSKNYDENWILPKLVKRGCGIHNGRLHRSLSQIQVKLFEEQDGLKNIVSTSSIIEGVNTSAENVVIWRNRKGTPKLDDFTYKNICGRGGRMFKHFVGKIYILEKPPASDQTQLDLEFPDDLLDEVDINPVTSENNYELTSDQVATIILHREEMNNIMGADVYEELLSSGLLRSVSYELTKKIAFEIHHNKETWGGLGCLNSSNPNMWESYLYKTVNLQPGGWGIEYRKFVAFVKVLSCNWASTIPEILDMLDNYDIGIDKFFDLERKVCFNLSSVLSDINVIQDYILRRGIDISPFVSKLSHAFLPPVVYQLEEYGLPRMISRKIQGSGMFNFEFKELDVHQAVLGLVDLFNTKKQYLQRFLDDFDFYILDYFIDGVTIDK